MSDTRQPRGPHGISAIFAIPAALAVVSSIGLAAALLTDGMLDLIWSALVAVPLLLMGRGLLKRQG